MPHFYYQYTQHTDSKWAVRFSPEVWSENQNNRLNRVNGLLYLLYTDSSDKNIYGKRDNLVMFEGKNLAEISWWRLMRDQLWNQADSFKRNSGRLLVMGLIAYYFCVFRFDVAGYLNRGDYENFNPLRPSKCNNWTEEDFEEIGANCLTYNNTITVIKWKWNDPTHHEYIHELIYYISRNRP